MPRRPSECVRFVAVVALWMAMVGPASAQAPKLIVILVVDQFRADYVTTYGHHWTKGLRRLFDEGAWFSEAAYPYATTVTCAGHATVATGTFPSTHGMISNSWFDREAGRSIRCTRDPDVPVVSYGAQVDGGESPHQLLVPTLSDELRLQLDGDSRVATFSLKERSAIMLAGHGADAAVWHGGGNTWLTSSAYTRQSVPFLADFIRERPIDRDYGVRWTRMLPIEQYLYDDEAIGERPPADWEGTFPHVLEGEAETSDRQFFERWRTSPWSDAYLNAMALAAIDALELGQRETTDYLGIGYSALDLVGHRFGPSSHEVQDVLVRLDVTVGALLDALDARVGPNNYVIGLSADHGVSPIPEQVAARGIDAGRMRNRELRERLENALAPFLGPGERIAGMAANGVYFTPGVYERLQGDSRALDAAIEALRGSPGIDRVFRGETLSGRRESIDDLERAAALSYHPDRSGDLLIMAKPYWIGGNAASHGTANLYDRRVPVLLFGAGIRGGRYHRAATPADIAPTLAYLVGVTLAEPDGRVLAEALEE